MFAESRGYAANALLGVLEEATERSASLGIQRGWWERRVREFNIAMQGASQRISPEGKRDMADKVRGDREGFSGDTSAAAVEDIIEEVQRMMDKNVAQMSAIAPIYNVVKLRYENIELQGKLLNERLIALKQGQLELLNGDF